MAYNLDLYQPPTQPLSAERFTQGAIGTLLSPCGPPALSMRIRRTKPGTRNRF